MKKLLLLVAVFYITPLFCLTTVSAQEKKKVVTGTVKLMSPTDVQLLDEYMFLTYGGKIISSGVAEDVRNETGKSLDALFKEVFRC